MALFGSLGRLISATHALLTIFLDGPAVKLVRRSFDGQSSRIGLKQEIQYQRAAL
jgi:hypothetical protein